MRGRTYRVAVLIAGLSLLTAACSGDDAATTTTTAPPPTTSPTTTGAPPATTTVPPATTTTAPPTTTTTAAPTANTDVAAYRVIDVADDDILNVRSGPGVDNDVIAMLSPYADGVLTTGTATFTDDGAEWWEVVISTGLTGWVNSRFLESVDQTSAPFADVPCSADLSDGGHGPTSFPATGSATSDADHVVRVETVSGGGCERTVVVLGTDFDFTDTSPEAAEVPAGIVAEVLRAAPASVRIDMPSIFHSAPSAAGSGSRKVVRADDGPTDTDGFHPVYVDILTGPGAVGVTYRNDPARIVVDYLAVPLGPGYPQRAEGSSVELVSPAVTDPLAVVANGSEFHGYARGFEASLFVQLFEEFGIDPVVADFATTRGFGPTTTASSIPISTTDYIEAWGEFGFTISGLDPGTYTLVLSTDNAAGTVSHTDLVYRFTVP